MSPLHSRAWLRKGTTYAAISQCSFEQDVGIDADQFAVAVGVTVAGSGHARTDVAKHRASVAADFIVDLSHARCYPAAPGSPHASVRRRWNARDAGAGRVMDGVEDCGRSRDQSLLADPFCAKGSDGRRLLDENAFHRRHVADGGNQIVVQVLAFAGNKLFHQRHAEALRRAAFDLSLNQRRIDGLADVVRGGHPEDLDAAEFDVHLHLGDMGAEAEHCIGFTLAVFVERSWSEDRKCFGTDDVTRLVERQSALTSRRERAPPLR